MACSMHRHIPVSIVIAATILVMVAKDMLIGDAGWWNLVMAALLLVALADYLRRKRSQSE